MAPDQNPADGNTNTWRISFSLDSANVFESFFPRSKIIPFNENDINVNDHVIVPESERKLKIGRCFASRRFEGKPIGRAKHFVTCRAAIMKQRDYLQTGRRPLRLRHVKTRRICPLCFSSAGISLVSACDLSAGFGSIRPADLTAARLCQNCHTPAAYHPPRITLIRLNDPTLTFLSVWIGCRYNATKRPFRQAAPLRYTNEPASRFCRLMLFQLSGTWN